MKLVHRDLFDSVHTISHDTLVLVVTTNRMQDSRGCLVMGAGAAKQMAELYPLAPCKLGRIVDAKGKGDYYLVVWEEHRPRLGALQAKRHWRDPSPIGLVLSSIEALRRYALENQDLEIHVNFPGIGLGGLKEQEPIILKALEQLPSNVFVHKL